jgi:hypothetical protein
MDADARVCPFCGEPPGTGVFCAACGRNLAQVEQLPTRREWEGDREGDGASAPPSPAAAVAAFVAAMHGARDPGATRVPLAEPGFLGRTRHVDGWVVKAVDHDAGEAGLFVTVDGRLHRLDTASRGLGQRADAVQIDTVGPEAGERADARRLAEDLAAVLRANGLAT